MDIIRAINERHSVRNYLANRIEADKVELLKKKIEELNVAGNLNFQFKEDAGKTYNKLMNKFMGLGSAPSVIACVGKDDGNLDQRVGYYGEQLVLYAQQLGLNTCWAGTFNRENIGAEVGPGERLAISIAIGYGKDSGKPHRSKDISQISESEKGRPDWFEKGVQAALLAPTAINQQKFKIKLKADETVEFTDLGGVLSQIDLGIVKYHFEAGSGRKVEL
ncbi:MAG: nitroreductase [Lachnospiraceae bacterium]|nr:nitroreductase [Lachnospiraceae bacterium]